MFYYDAVRAMLFYYDAVRAMLFYYDAVRAMLFYYDAVCVVYFAAGRTIRLAVGESRLGVEGGRAVSSLLFHVMSAISSPV